MNALSIILLLACLLNGYLAVVCFKYRRAPGAVSFGVFLLTIVLYSLGYAFEIHSRTLPEILFWLKVEYLGISFFPTFLFIFLVQFLGKEYWLKPWVLLVLFSFSTSTLLIHFTNSATHWFYKTITASFSDNLFLIHTSKGFWYWAHQAFSVLFMGLFSIWFLIRSFTVNDYLKRKQFFLMFASSVAPWVCYVIYITGNSPDDLDIIPFSFIVMGFVMGFAMIRYKLFNLSPLALENVFESMSDGVIIIDQDGKIVNYNRASRDIFPELSEGSIGSSVFNLVNNSPVLCKLIQGGDSVNQDVAIYSGDRMKHFEVKGSVVFSKNKVPVGKTLIFRDITERKQTEELLLSNQERLTKLNQTKNKIFSIIGHDLRGSLGNIQTIATILNKSNGDPTNINIYKTLLNSSQQSLKLLENLLMWAKSQTEGIKSFPVEFSLPDLVKETVEVLKPIATEKDISIDVSVPEITIFADQQMISLVVRNLVSNAVKFTHQKGKVSITAEAPPGETIIRVEDSGIGIPHDFLNDMFRIDRNISRIGTASEPGTGLGLLLCKEFIDHHHGNIGVEKTSEAGTVFFVSVPTNHIPTNHNKDRN